jgi:3-oxoadipate enol-lactonase
VSTTSRWTGGLGELSYATAGDAGRPTVVLLHAVGTSSHMWDEVVPLLAPHAHVLAIDLLGHGCSGDPVRELTIPDHADAVAGLITHLGLGRTTLVGTSLGALIALDLTARHGGLVSSLLLNGCPGWHLESQRTARLMSIAARLGPAGIPAADFPLLGTATPPTETVAAQRRADLQRCGRGFLSSWWAIAAFDPISRLSRITCPTHVVMGETDFHLATSYTLVDGVAGAQMTVIPGAGHLTPFDKPAEIARIALDSVGCR